MTPSHGSCLDPNMWLGAKESQVVGRVSQEPKSHSNGRGRTSAEIPTTQSQINTRGLY